MAAVTHHCKGKGLKSFQDADASLDQQIVVQLWPGVFHGVPLEARLAAEARLPVLLIR